MDEELSKYRRLINFYDDLIIEYLNDRIKICQELGEYKKEHNIPIYNAGREEEVIKRLEGYEQFDGLVRTIWPTIMNYSKTIQ